MVVLHLTEGGPKLGMGRALKVVVCVVGGTMPEDDAAEAPDR